MPKIERRCCLISASYLAGLFDIFILLRIFDRIVCFGDLTNEDTL